MSDLIEFILARIAEDEASGNEHRRREAQTRREVVLYCRQRLDTGEICGCIRSRHWHPVPGLLSLA